MAGDIVAIGDGRCGPECGLALGLVACSIRDIGEVEPPGTCDGWVIDRFDCLTIKLIGLSPVRPQGERPRPVRQELWGRRLLFPIGHAIFEDLVEHRFRFAAALLAQ